MRLSVQSQGMPAIFHSWIAKKFSNTLSGGNGQFVLMPSNNCHRKADLKGASKLFIALTAKVTHISLVKLTVLILQLSFWNMICRYIPRDQISYLYYAWLESKSILMSPHLQHKNSPFKSLTAKVTHIWLCHTHSFDFTT